jgi:hypothetical protein
VIKFVFRWAFRLLLLVIVLVVGLLLLKDNIARSFAEQRIRQGTGFDTKVGKLQLALLEPRFTIENLVLYNPAEIGGSPFLDAPDIQAEYAPGELALGKVRFKFLRLNIRELHIMQTDGRTNVIDLLRKIPFDRRAPKGEGRAGKYAFTGIDVLNLSIGKVRYTDPRRPKRNQEINLGLENHIVRNVRSEEDLADVLLKVLFRAGVTLFVDDRSPPRQVH